MAYHLTKPYHEWLSAHTLTFERRFSHSVAISTDGIATYARHNHLFTGFDVPRFLLVERGKTLLQKQLELEALGLRVNDDVGVVVISKPS